MRMLFLFWHCMQLLLMFCGHACLLGGHMPRSQGHPQARSEG